jgi:two-component system, cell cycle sensor histidine kinase and response regulator CckA
MIASSCIESSASDGRIMGGQFAPSALAAGAGLVVLDENGRATAANDGWRQFATSLAQPGSPACVPGQNYKLFCHQIGAPDATIIEQGIDLVLCDGHPGFTWEFRFGPEQATRWHILTVTRMLSPIGGAVVAVFDITGQKQAQRSLELFRRLIDQSSDAIFVVDPESARILDVNERACTSLGYSRNDLLRRTMFDIEAAYDGFTWPEQVERARAGELEILEVGQRRSTGETFPVEITLKHVELENRAYIVAAARDITEKKQLEAKYLRAQRLESVGRLAGGIAHDLNNVLSPILLSIQLLREKLGDANSQEILNLMEKSAKRGSSMIRQVLTFARGARGERIAVRVPELIDDLVKIGKETFPRSVQIKVSIEEDVWPATGDPTQLHQVLMNLCVNACDAMPEGGVLELRAENCRLDERQARGYPDARPGAFAVLSVRDTGAGIAPEMLDKIFEPFFTTKSFGKGTGLGLATALGIIRGHEGFVTVETQLGKGSCFKVFLPSRCDDNARPQEKAAFPAHRGKNQLVLVVDDEKAIRLVTQAVLTAHGYDVLTADDGAEAVALYKDKQHRIEAIIMDMSMPFMDGSSAIKAIRQVNPDVPILAVSGLVDSEQLPAMTGQARLPLLGKPFSPDQLLRALSAIIAPKA